MLGLQNKYVNEDSAMWFDVDYNIVLDFLSKLKIPSQIAKIENMDDFKKWYETEFDNDRMKNWTIVASGAKNKIHTTLDDFKHFKINLPTRTKVIWDNRPEDKDIIDLKTITQPEDMLMDIDESMPKDEQIGEYLKAKEIATTDVKVGDTVIIMGYDGKAMKHKVIGFGTKDWVNGMNVNGIPYVDLYGDNERGYDWNCNNYIHTETVRVVEE
jgi:hypothetical protein